MNIVSLREQVYQFLRDQMQNGSLLPGAAINLNQISRQLGISKTPLRDALIRLECEGFVSILPRKGVIVKAITLLDIKNYYGIVGALEGLVVREVFPRLGKRQINSLKRINTALIKALELAEYDRYYELNLEFHDVFLKLSANTEIRTIIMPMKQRLYDFPRLRYIEAWEKRNCREHRQFIALIEEGDREGAARLMQDVHWSYGMQEKHIRQFHSNVEEHIRSELSSRRSNVGRVLHVTGVEQFTSG